MPLLQTVVYICWCQGIFPK